MIYVKCTLVGLLAVLVAAILLGIATSRCQSEGDYDKLGRDSHWVLHSTSYNVTIKRQSPCLAPGVRAEILLIPSHDVVNQTCYIVDSVR
jgi:hypothetical protein